MWTGQIQRKSADKSAWSEEHVTNTMPVIQLSKTCTRRDVIAGNILSHGSLVTSAVAGQQLHDLVSTGNAWDTAHFGRLAAAPTAP